MFSILIVIFSLKFINYFIIIIIIIIIIKINNTI